MVNKIKKKIKELIKDFKALQFSKIITLVLIAMNFITWLLGLIFFWKELDYFNYMLEFTKSLSEIVLPYFCLSAADRMVYIAQYAEKYFENVNKGKNKKQKSIEEVEEE